MYVVCSKRMYVFIIFHWTLATWVGEAGRGWPAGGGPGLRSLPACLPACSPTWSYAARLPACLPPQPPTRPPPLPAPAPGPPPGRGASHAGGHSVGVPPGVGLHHKGQGSRWRLALAAAGARQGWLGRQACGARAGLQAPPLLVPSGCRRRPCPFTWLAVAPRRHHFAARLTAFTFPFTILRCSGTPLLRTVCGWPPTLPVCHPVPLRLLIVVCKHVPCRRCCWLASACCWSVGTTTAPPCRCAGLGWAGAGRL